jgi:hypothetical protein
MILAGGQGRQSIILIRDSSANKPGNTKLEGDWGGDKG